MTDRLPLHSEAAEQGLLGSILQDATRVIPLCIEAGVCEEAFYIPAHRNVFKMCMWLHDKGKPVHVLSITDPLRDKGKLEKIGGEFYLDKLVDVTPTAAHAEHYIEEVMGKYRSRRFIESARRTESLLYEGEELDVALPEHMQEMLDLGERKIRVTKDQAWRKMMQRAEHIRNGGIAGLPTPWDLFNEAVGGAPFGDPTIVAGREGTRKSYFVNQWALCAAKDHGVPGAYFTMEDGVDQTIARSACYMAGISPWNMFVRGRYTTDEMEVVDKAAKEVIALPLAIIGDRGYTIDEIGSEVARGVAKHGWRYVFLDAFKDVYGKGHSTQERDLYKVMRIADIARRHDIALIVVHHINKAKVEDQGYADDNDDQKISYRAITGAGEITKSARLVMMLQCRAYRNETGVHLDPASFEIDAQKHNHGPTGSVRLVLDEHTGRFDVHPEAAELHRRTKIQYALTGKQ